LALGGGLNCWQKDVTLPIHASSGMKYHRVLKMVSLHAMSNCFEIEYSRMRRQTQRALDVFHDTLVTLPQPAKNPGKDIPRVNWDTLGIRLTDKAETPFRKTKIKNPANLFGT